MVGEMSSRAALVLALVAGVVAPDIADAGNKQPHAKVSRKKTKAKKKKKKKTVSRTPSAKTIANVKNMPHGYAWPPSKQMLAAEDACAEQLASLGVKFQPAQREGRIVSALTITPDADGTITLGGITYRSAFRKGAQKLDCQLALALHGFGEQLAANGVREVKFGSIFRWTNVRVNGETKPFLSRHALGIAMDIVSFTDETGREANVKRDYPAGDPLLLAIEDAVNGCGKFRTLLTPKNDPISHSDHFHLEVAVDYTASR